MKSDDMSLSDDSHDVSLAHGKGSSQQKCSSWTVEHVKSWYSSRLQDKEGTASKSSKDKEVIDLADDDEVMDDVKKDLKEAEQFYLDYVRNYPDSKLPYMSLSQILAFFHNDMVLPYLKDFESRVDSYYEARKNTEDTLVMGRCSALHQHHVSVQ